MDEMLEDHEGYTLERLAVEWITNEIRQALAARIPMDGDVEGIAELSDEEFDRLCDLIDTAKAEIVVSW